MITSLKNAYLNQTNLFHISIVLVGVLIVYWPVYQFEYLIGWDDQWFVTNQYTEDGLTWNNLLAILTNFHYGQYAPLNQLYYTVLYSLFEYNSGFYHVVGIGIHLVNAYLVYSLIKKIAPKLVHQAPLQIKQISFLTSFIFAIMPINVEPVAWVAASKVTIYALFYLIALNYYCRYLSGYRSKYYYLTLLFFVFSFGGKEQAVLLPLCLLLFDYVFNRSLINKKVWIEKIPFFILSLLFGIITLKSQGIEAETVPFYPIYQRIPLAFYTLSEYFTKSLIPVNISYLYPFPFQIGEEVPWWVWTYVLAIPLIIYCFYNQIKSKWLLFGLLFFFINIVLVINALPLARHSVIADRYTYVATIGLCFAISYLFIHYFQKKKFRIPLSITGILYIALLIAYSSYHIHVWTNVHTLKSKLKNTIEMRDEYNRSLR